VASYFIKNKGLLYRFDSWKQFEDYWKEDYTNKSKNLIYGIRNKFPRGEIAGHWNAYFKGWIDGNGQSRGLPKGNDWEPRQLIKGDQYDVAF
jgi:hypothetical protein